MRTGSLSLALPVLALASSCAVTGPAPGAPARARGDIFDFDLSVSPDEELDELEFDPETPPGPRVDLPVERSRTKLRFAFGGEAARGYVQFLSEELEMNVPPVAPYGGIPTDFDMLGFGGGVKGAPRVNGSAAEVAFLIPYRLDVALLLGVEDDPAPAVPGDDVALVYYELQADFGLGAEWKGLRASGGLATSSIYGRMEAETSSNGEVDFSGANSGVYGELRYKHPDFPVYAQVRATVGDLERTEFGLGVAF